MPDPRFFESTGPLSLEAICQLTGARATESLADLAVDRVAIASRGGTGAVVFVTGRGFLEDLRRQPPSACFVPEVLAADLPAGCVPLVHRNPHGAFALSAEALHAPRRHLGVDPISPEARLEAGVSLGPGVVVGPGAAIGAGTVIGPNTVIGPGVAIGRNCRIGANVSISFTLVGDRVKILAGAVIGEAGFGATAGATGLIDIPQLGRVILQDGVTIGAGCTIDRGAYEDTVIGENSKLDNMVHIAHNVRIGRNCVLAAQTGIAGSVTIGDGCQFGGQAGIADHLIIGDGARIGASGGVLKNVPAGETWGGFPAKPVQRWLREVAWLSRAAGVRSRGGES
ncbi:UDP-3-O-(3-hydroxymyristoyl)glucosamine N-acyltransferase [Phenylobacterium sp.]|uniref:UDP-3-O-(3-hydroxymyristoyl)glucosamine N-acyltransferase n=1 Tax=Phenylobacterium sp. TaxID=1871053 RepID=UPI0025D5A482|nr:UDP-3-O-(3-hydroxymyristoyl)glucosamine N-acyltransferase [Phenylobacterium sp.]MCA3713865.1 UDP-3-O-(3-hydroxymyristoyl)glucosamine N-acyltransferase [Phenylobacterium sp.]